MAEKLKKVGDMTRAEMNAVPMRSRWDEHIKCRSIVILPTRRVHDSGYRCMDFLAVAADDTPICRLSGCSDVIHIDGIGGYGQWNPRVGGPPHMVEPKDWSIDCLKKSRLLRLFARRDLIAGASLSSFELYCSAKSQSQQGTSEKS